MQNNVDILGVYSRSGGSFVRFNSNNPSTMRAVVSATHEVTHKQADCINVELRSVVPVTDIEVGDYMLYDGGTFRLITSPTIVKQGERLYSYQYTFQSSKYDLQNVVFMLPITTTTDDYNGTLSEFLQLLIDNANRVYPNEWQFTNSVALPSEAVNINFGENNCLSVLQSLFEQEEWKDYDYEITESGNVKTINVVKYDRNVDVIDAGGIPFQYGKGNGLYTIEMVQSSGKNIVNRLFVFGSSENLPTRYFAPRLGLAVARQGGTIGDKRLSYVEDGASQALYGVIEGIETFDSVKPHREGTLTMALSPVSNHQTIADTSITFDLNATWQNTNSDYTEYLTLRNLADTPQIYSNYVANVVGQSKYLDGTAQVTFNSGDLAGMTFNIANYNHVQHSFQLQPLTESGVVDPITGQATNIVYPNASIKANVGDTYVFIGILLPIAYLNDAESELLTKANERIADLKQPQATYNIKIAQDWVLEHFGVHTSDIISCGKYLHIKDDGIGVDKNIKIDSYTRNLVTGYDYDVTITDFERVKKANPNIIRVDARNDMAVSFGGGSSDITLDAEFSANSSTLNVEGVDNTQTNAVLQVRSLGRSWNVVVPQSLTMPNMNRGYYIKASMHKVRNECSLSLSVVNDTSIGEIAESAEYWSLIIGEISPVQMASTISRSFRMVTMYYGVAKNPSTEFAGIEIASVSGNLKIKLSDLAGASEEQVSLVNPNTNASFVLNNNDGLVMERPQAKSEGVTARIACYRGDFHPAKYNDGDMVRVALPDGNYTTYRCIADGTDQQEEISPESPNWVALAPTNVGGGGGTTTLITINNHTMVATGTPVSVSGNSLIIAQ